MTKRILTDLEVSSTIKSSTTEISAPTFNTYGAGVRHILYDNVGSTSAGYTLGINAGTFWQTIPAADGGQSFKWYGGTTVLATLTGGGALSTSGDITAGNNLRSSYSSGDEGGQIFLNKSVTNTSINSGVNIDVYQNKLRIWEDGGTNRGVYIDITSAGAGVGTNLLGTATDTNYYPSAIVFNAGTTSGPTLDLTMSGSGAPDLTAVAIPSASATASGVVTTGTQTFAGTKTLTSPTIDIINAASSTSTTADLFGNVTSGTVGIADGLQNGTLNIGNGTATAGTRTVNINTNGSSSLGTTTNIGSSVIGGTINLAVGLPGVIFTSTGLISTSGVTGGNSSVMTIRTGNTTTSGNSGNLVLDVGTAAGTAGTVSLGATASGVTIGKTGTTTTINGSLSATGVPFAMAANRTTTVGGTALAANAQETAVTVTFPTSRFSVVPAVTANTSSPRYAVAVSGVSSTGFTMTVRNVSDATGTTYTYNWMAIQMTSGAVSG